MDLLEQYKQQHPEAFKEKPKWQPPSEYGFFIRLVMRLSGGRIREVREATYVLLGGAIVMAVVAIIVLIVTFSSSPTPALRIPPAGPGDPNYHPKK